MQCGLSGSRGPSPSREHARFFKVRTSVLLWAQKKHLLLARKKQLLFPIYSHHLSPASFAFSFTVAIFLLDSCAFTFYMLCFSAQNTHYIYFLNSDWLKHFFSLSLHSSLSFFFKNFFIFSQSCPYFSLISSLYVFFLQGSKLQKHLKLVNESEIWGCCLHMAHLTLLPAPYREYAVLCSKAWDDWRQWLLISGLVKPES